MTPAWRYGLIGLWAWAGMAVSFGLYALASVAGIEGGVRALGLSVLVILLVVPATLLSVYLRERGTVLAVVLAGVAAGVSSLGAVAWVQRSREVRTLCRLEQRALRECGAPREQDEQLAQREDEIMAREGLPDPMKTRFGLTCAHLWHGFAYETRACMTWTLDSSLCVDAHDRVDVRPN